MAKFIKVDEVPGVEKKYYARLKADFQEFMDMNVKVAKVDLTQYNYKSTIVASQVMSKSLQRHGFPVDLVRRKNEIYLIRRDM